MYVTVHRGTQQIGGNLIEIGTANTRLLFDAGANLPPLDGSVSLFRRRFGCLGPAAV